MKLCCSYKSDERHRKLCQEVRFSVGAMSLAITYQEEHPESTIILEIINLESAKLSIDKLHDILSEYPNWVIDCYEVTDFLMLYKENFPHIMYHYPVTNYNTLGLFARCHPFAITIGEPLTFDVAYVRKCVDSYQSEDQYVELRVLAAVGRPTGWLNIDEQDNGFAHFWILPQHTYLYEPYIDVLDLYDKNIVREQALIDTYVEGQYDDKLDGLVKNYSGDMIAHMITEEFVNKRLSCRQRCMCDKYGCHYCDMFHSIVDTIAVETEIPTDGKLIFN